jgi:aspartate carbamoyltransferase catalytic subunit
MHKKRDLVSISDLTKSEIEETLALARSMENHPPRSLCEGNILASCFFEPSTRTRLSFEAAMLRLGGNSIGFAEGNTTSAKKGESLHDAIQVIGSYADILVVRHPQEGSARVAANATEKPVINAGDGANQHPSQTLLDLYTIRKAFGTLNGLAIAVAGDLKYGRTVHSLVQALSHFGPRLYFVSVEELQLPNPIAGELRKAGIKFSFHHSLEEVLPKCDVLYMTRIQKERFRDGESFHNPCVLKKAALAQAKPELKILHPLPRVDEIESAIDHTPHALYFQQAANGVAVRMAILAQLLGKE